MTLQAGFAELDVTPAVGCDLVGQFHRRIAESVLDPLHANAAAFENQDGAAGILSLDLCLVPEAWVDSIRARVAAATSIPAEAILVAATHTHTGPPSTEVLLYEHNFDPAYTETVQAQAAAALIQAWTARRPAHLAFGKRYVSAGMNRRAVFADGTGAMYGAGRTQEEIIGLEGPADPETGIVVVRDANTHTLLGTVLNYTCHATCIGADTRISADYPGAARAWLQKRFGTDTGVVYLNGACGNVAPANVLNRDQGYRGEKGMAAMGRMLGQAVDSVLNHTTEHEQFTDDVPIAAAQQVFKGPLRYPSEVEVEAAKPKLKALVAEHPDRMERDPAVNREIYYAGEAIRIHEQAQATPDLRIEAQVLRLGQVAIAGNPCELFTEWGLSIKAQSPAAMTMVSELSNGYKGYLPTRTALRHGGYETWLARSSCLAPEAGDRLVQASQELLQSLWC